jgi:hypothetical protein
MIWELFIFGGFWFWLLVAGLLVVIELSTMSENHWGFGWLVLFCGILCGLQRLQSASPGSGTIPGLC